MFSLYKDTLKHTNLFHKTEELSRFEYELFLEFFAIIEYSKNSSFSNRGPLAQRHVCFVLKQSVTVTSLN